MHQAGVQPVVVGVLGGQRALDLLVGDDPPRGGVDQEHPARLQPALGDDVGGRDVEHADLAGEDHQVVLGLPPAARAQAVAVEDGADQRAVGEGDRGRAVPGLHDRGVEPVEGPAGRVHLVVVLPRLRDHHQHRVRQRPARQVQQLEHLVEGRRVAEVAGGDREDPVQARARTAGPAGPSNSSVASFASRARIRLRLPLIVLISPLCAMKRNGWASGQLGNVLVENRLCTSAIADS